MHPGLSEKESYLSDPPVDYSGCSDPEDYAQNVLRWALGLAVAAERAPELIRNSFSSGSGGIDNRGAS